MAHVLLGHLGSDQVDWWPSRGHLDGRAVEIEAEAVAYIVTRHLGLEGTSHAYVSHYFGSSDTVPKSVSFHMIAKVAGKIENMALGLLPEPRTRAKRAAAPRDG